MTYPTGETIADRYVLQDVIGEGGQAIVCRALDTHSGQHVAVKILNDRASRSAEVLERVRREQQAMVALAGTHAVGFQDLCRAPSGALCLVMELLSGRDLEHRLHELESSGAFMSIDELVRVMTPIVDTLDKAHAVGIVHRDLKPGNMFLVDAATGGATRLLDFGFARLAGGSHVTQAGMVMGSPSYIAPEMWLGRSGEVSARSDVYSLSVVLYRMVGGRLPFEGETLQEKFILATTAERPSLHALRPDLPDKIDLWAERALAIDPTERFPTVRSSWNELLWALERAPRPKHRTIEEPREPSRDVATVREWLDAPSNTLPERLNSAWRKAVGALRRLREAVANATLDSKPPARPSGEPPPLPGERQSARLKSDAPAREARKTIRGPLPLPKLPPVGAAPAEGLGSPGTAGPLPPRPAPPPGPGPDEASGGASEGLFAVVPPPLPAERAEPGRQASLEPPEAETLLRVPTQPAPVASSPASNAETAQDPQTLLRVDAAQPPRSGAAPNDANPEPRTLLRMPSDPSADRKLLEVSAVEPQTLLHIPRAQSSSTAAPTPPQPARPTPHAPTPPTSKSMEKPTIAATPLSKGPFHGSRVLVQGPESGVSATGETMPLDDFLGPEPSGASPTSEAEPTAPARRASVASDAPARKTDRPSADDDTLVAFDEPLPVRRKTTPLPPSLPRNSEAPQMGPGQGASVSTETREQSSAAKAEVTPSGEPERPIQRQEEADSTDTDRSNAEPKPRHRKAAKVTGKAAKATSKKGSAQPANQTEEPKRGTKATKKKRATTSRTSKTEETPTTRSAKTGKKATRKGKATTSRAKSSRSKSS